MCVACFTTAQLATVGAVSARWWWVNKRRPSDEVPGDMTDDAPTKGLDHEPAPVA
jgi:hypothetical protein